VFMLTVSSAAATNTLSINTVHGLDSGFSSDPDPHAASMKRTTLFVSADAASAEPSSDSRTFGSAFSLSAIQSSRRRRLGGNESEAGCCAAGGQTICWNSAGRAYAFGDNTYGGLGDGTKTERFNATAVSSPLDSDSDVVGCSASCYGQEAHNLCWTHLGKVYGFGYNMDGQHGAGSKSTAPAYGLVTPTAASSPLTSGVAGCSAGGYSSVCWMSTGEVYGFGDNTYGQMGRGGIGGDQIAPSLVSGSLSSGVAECVAGTHSMFCWTAAGQVFGWGRNSYGQLGDGTTTTRSTPTAANSPLTSGVAGCAANYHTICWTTAGAAYGFGRNYYG
jgi:alpha-tubulin suppressor-like RCC1 family protein